jgi:hypothetical protein
MQLGRASSLAVLFLLGSICGTKADSRIETGGNYVRIYITGRVTALDARKIEGANRELERSSVEVYLDSPGGDVSAALTIGRLIRKNDGFTIVGWFDSDRNKLPFDAKCYSSCALIFISGVFRQNNGLLGLHRPYIASSPQGREAIEKQFPLMLSALKEYVAEMGITDNFYQLMVNTEPANIMVYKQDAFKEIIPENDPVFAEITISRQARRFGVDTAEMRKREQLALGCEHLSSDTKRYFVCIDAIDWGLSEPIYHKRRSRLSDCKLSNEDQEVLDAIPKRLRFDHPLFIRRETCERNVMLDQ